MSTRRRDYLAVPGVVLLGVAAPLSTVSYLAYLVLWYLGCALIGAWLALDIRGARRRP